MSDSIAILGAGIMGVTTALYLARRGKRVCLFDRQAKILQGASRWNEGKIHLGYLYSGDLSGKSARAMLAAGLAFRPLIEDLISAPLAPHVTPRPDNYIVHPKSVISAEAVGAHFARVDALVKGHDVSGYLGPTRPTRQLPLVETGRLCGPNGLAGFEVHEYSVNTQWLADRLAEAVAAQSGIEVALDRSVVGLAALSGGWQGPWSVQLDDGRSHGPFDAVVNALWQGRPAIDHALGLPVAGPSQHRYRKSLFIETRKPFDVPSRVFVVGPFGDLKNYDGTSFYVSWYPAGLIAQGEGINPPEIPGQPADRDVLRQTREQIEYLAPDMAQVFASADRVRVEGGWVYARGSGGLDDAKASIHRRDRYGITRHGSYFSVDTGKYSTAPFLARAIAGSIAS